MTETGLVTAAKRRQAPLALGGIEFRELGDAGVETPEILAAVPKQAAKGGDMAFVGRPQRQPRIVERLRKAGLPRIDAVGQRAARQGRGQRLEPGGFRAAFFAARKRSGIERGEIVACRKRQPGQFAGKRLARPVAPPLIAPRARPEPALHAKLLDGARKRFAERGIARQVQQLVRQFVEQQRHQSGVVAAEHGAQHRIVEDAEGRIGRHAADENILAFGPELRGLRPGATFREVTAIGNASGYGETPGAGLDGELGGGNDVPYDVVAIESGEASIAAVVGQTQFRNRELPRVADQAEARGQRRGRVRVVEQAIDRRAFAQHLELPARGLEVIAGRQKQRQGQRQGQGEQQTERGKSHRRANRTQSCQYRACRHDPDGAVRDELPSWVRLWRYLR